MAKKKKTKKRTVYRSSVTGRFVSKRYSQKKPRITEKERVRIKK